MNNGKCRVLFTIGGERFNINSMRILYFLIFTFYLLFSLACNAAAPVSVSNQPVSINDVRLSNQPPSKPLGEMGWTLLDGKTNADGADEKLKSLRGKVVILDFWATYCPPCLDEIPHLKQLQAKYGRENVRIIGLHIGGEDDRPKVPAFVEKLAIDYPLATPEDALIRFIFGGIDNIPQTAVFDKNGVLVEKFVGFGENTKIGLDSAVSRALND